MKCRIAQFKISNCFNKIEIKSLCIIEIGTLPSWIVAPVLTKAQVTVDRLNEKLIRRIALL